MRHSCIQFIRLQQKWRYFRRT